MARRSLEDTYLQFGGRLRGVWRTSIYRLGKLLSVFRRRSRKVGPAPVDIPITPKKPPRAEEKKTPGRRWWFCRGCQKQPLMGKQPVCLHYPDPQYLSSKMESILAERASALESVESSCPLPTLQSETNLPMNVTAISKMFIKINSRKEDILVCSDQEKLDFLRALSASCIDALEMGKKDPGLRPPKIELIKAIVVVLESLPLTSVPSPVLSCAMLALYHLSKFKPSLNRDMESHVLRLILYQVFTMESSADRKEDFYISSCSTLELLLKGFLTEDGTVDHLLFLLKHINFWLQGSREEKLRALTCASALIDHATDILGPKAAEQFPEWGQMVCQYIIHISSSNPVVSEAARDVLSSMYKFLCIQKRLSLAYIQEFWCPEYCDTEMLGYVDTCLAVEREVVQKSILDAVHQLKEKNKIPRALQVLLHTQDDLIIEDLEN
ncbi:uncharacterized protein LOC121920376 isoform X2 [Sceloporus undulatus]|uniref:uncharacterized protein LOC121920376 isoform X2 n=1 Tax=Sceloporus undulatus TaxID=8520 RepID=UPI001C4CFAA5|nr:uncharacterized protein LOC121920376 isoform X2 [Sceloporus undulatus]